MTEAPRGFTRWHGRLLLVMSMRRSSTPEVWWVDGMLYNPATRLWTRPEISTENLAPLRDEDKVVVDDAVSTLVEMHEDQRWGALRMGTFVARIEQDAVARVHRNAAGGVVVERLKPLGTCKVAPMCPSMGFV